jgi:hypothetical protein
MMGHALATRINRLPKWAREFIRNIETFVGAPEVQELTYLRDQNRALVKLVGELKRETARLYPTVTDSRVPGARRGAAIW